MNASDEEAARQYIRRMYDDPIFAMREIISITDKSGKPIQYDPWPSQIDFEKHKTRVNLVIKVRRQGFTVGRMARRMVDARLQENRDALFLNKDDVDNAALFKTIRYMDKNLPAHFKGKKFADQAKSIHYEDTNFTISIQTAGQTVAQSSKKGRGTNVFYLHITEAGYIKYLGDLLQGAVNTVPDDGEITLESTSSGPRGTFSQMCVKVMTKGKQESPNRWVLDDQSFFFNGVLQHPEYVRPVLGAFDTIDEEEERLMGLGATPEQVMWRRWKVNQFAVDRENTSALPPEKQFKREYPATIQDALEEAGGLYFNPKVMVLIRDYVKHQWPEPVELGLLKASGSEVMTVPPTNDNRYQIWSPPAQGWKNRYLLFADCAQGTEGGDWDVGYVGDLVTREVVAAYRGKLGAEMHTKFMLLLGAYYDNALIAWDCSGIGAELRPLLINSLYPNLWTRYEIAPGRAKTASMLHAEPQALGMVWTRGTKSEACSRARQAIELREWHIAHEPFYAESEYFAFQDKDDVNPEAAEGFHDDCISAFAGLVYVADRCGSPVKDIQHNSFEKLDKNKASLKKVLEEHRRQEHQKQWADYSM